MLPSAFSELCRHSGIILFCNVKWLWTGFVPSADGHKKNWKFTESNKKARKTLNLHGYIEFGWQSRLLSLAADFVSC